MRFSLFAPPDRHPILCVGNEKSKVFFWDLQALEEWDGVEGPERGGRFKLPRNVMKKGVARKIVKGIGGSWGGSGGREPSIASEGTTTTNSHSTLFLNDRPTPNRNATPAEYGNENGYEGHADPFGAGTLTLPKSLLTLTEDIAPSRARLKFSTDDPFRALLPHRTHVVPRVTFAARQVAWSVGGEWMVVVGDQGMVAVFEGRGS